MTIAWQDEQKRLTPDDVQSVSFPLSRLGRRGYDEEHVRAFLQEVEREIVTLLNEKVSLWNEVERLRRRIIAGMKSGNDGGGVLFGREDAHVHAVRILSNAQLTADRYVADAQAYSHRLTEEARSRRDEILTEAQQHADMVLEEASPAPARRRSRRSTPRRLRRRWKPTAARSRLSLPTCGRSVRSTAPTCAPTPRECCAASPSGSAAKPAPSSRRRPMRGAPSASAIRSCGRPAAQ